VIFSIKVTYIFLRMTRFALCSGSGWVQQRFSLAQGPPD
jgi:hypothetical protein